MAVAFKWDLMDSYNIGPVRAFNILLTSQQWHEYVWTHQITVLVPSENKYDGALLFITGGSNKKGLPKWNGADDKFAHALSMLAEKNKGIVALLRQTPNQPLVGCISISIELVSFLPSIREPRGCISLLSSRRDWCA